MMHRTDYDERIREAQEDGVGDDHFYMRRGGGVHRLFYNLTVGHAFYREMAHAWSSKEDALAEARRTTPEVLWELSKKRAHMLVAGTGRLLPGVDDGDELAAFGRALVSRALAPEGVWHVCWIKEGADVRWAGTPGTGTPGYVGYEESPDPLRLYLEELGQDFPGEIAWDESSAVGLLGALTRASGPWAERKGPGSEDGWLPRKKNTLVVVERPRSHAVLNGVKELIGVARVEGAGRHFGGVHVVLLTESPGSLPTDLVKRFGQWLAFPTTRAASRDVLEGSEDAAMLAESVSGFDVGKFPYAPAVLYDRERGVRDVFVACAPRDLFEEFLERVSHRRGGSEARAGASPGGGTR